MANILVFEDDMSFGDNLKIHLTALGHEVTLAREPATGIRSLLENPPDLIFSDIGMPHLNGLELLKAVRGEEATRRIPVIILTGRTDDDSYLEAMQLGATQYITKPAPLAELIKAVQSALGKSLSK